MSYIHDVVCHSTNVTYFRSTFVSLRSIARRGAFPGRACACEKQSFQTSPQCIAGPTGIRWAQATSFCRAALCDSRLAVVSSSLAAFFLLVPLSLPLPAFAENVRVQDVESNTLRAGLEAANEGRLDAAERFFKAYIAQEDPRSASAYSNLGNVHLQQGRVSQAVGDFSTAIDLAPEAPVPHLNRAIAYEQLGVDAAASGDFSRAQSLWRQAVEDCDVAITSDPKEFAAWFDRGNVQMRQEDWNAALESFSKAADLAPGLAGYRLRAAALLFQTGNTDKAQQQLRGLVRKYGNYAEAHAALAAMQWASGAVESAEEQLARALDADARTWGDIKAVRGVTRWPPMLYDAYSKLLSISN